MVILFLVMLIYKIYFLFEQKIFSGALNYKIVL
jgi:hypothetical protein